MDIQKILLTVVYAHFLTKFSLPQLKFLQHPKLFTLHFHTLANMFFRFKHKSAGFAPLLSLILIYDLSSAPV